MKCPHCGSDKEITLAEHVTRLYKLKGEEVTPLLYKGPPLRLMQIQRNFDCFVCGHSWEERVEQGIEDDIARLCNSPQAS